MHLRKGVLTTCTIMAVPALLLCAPALALHAPLNYAQGTWEGQAKSGSDIYTVSVTLRKVNKSFFGVYRGRSASGGTFQGNFDTSSPGGVYKVRVVSKGSVFKMFTFEVTATAKSGIELELDSLLGAGSLKFLNDFIKCELEFRSLGTRVNATLYRVNPPPPPPKKKGAGQKKKKAPSLPPMVIVPK